MSKYRVYTNIYDGDKNIYEFEAFKLFSDITHENYSNSEKGYGIYKGLYQLRNIYIDNILPISSSNSDVVSEPKNLDGSYQKLIYSSVENMFYEDYTDFYTHPLMEKRLFATASIFSIPQVRFGRKVQPGTFSFYDYSPVGAANVIAETDDYGNIRDVDIFTGSFATQSSLVAYWGFNEKYDEINRTSEQGSIANGIPKNIGYENTHNYELVGYYQNVGFSGGIKTTGDVEEASGVKANFDGTGYIKVKNTKDISFSAEEDYAISMWVDIPPIQAYTDSNTVGILTKRYIENHSVYDPSYVVHETASLRPTSKYAFDIEMYTHLGVLDAGKMIFNRSDGVNKRTVTSSIALPAGENHLLFQKTGSNMEIYINAVLDNTGSADVTYSTVNNHDLYIGSRTNTDGRVSGSLDEIRIYNTALTQDQISSLANNNYFSGSAYQTNVIGNLFPHLGFAVISDYRPKYKHVFLGETGQFDYGTDYGFDISYRSTVKIYENEFICKVRRDQYNTTTNPTIKKDKYGNVKEFATGSDFTPYITSVGLYDDSNQLLAVAKLATPIPKRSDVDMNFIIKFDS